MASPAGAVSWYAWWRYSSWLGGTSSWWSSSVATTMDPVSANANIDEVRLAGQATTEPPPTVKDAVFELLDELTMASEQLDTDRSEPILTMAPTTVVSFRLVCQVEGCSIRLTDVDSPFPLLSEAYVVSGCVSVILFVCGEI